MRTLQIILISLSVLSLAGCTAGFVHPPAGSPTAAQAYQAASNGQSYYGANASQAIQNQRNNQRVQRMPVTNLAYKTQKAPALNALNAQFPRIKNPEVLMYVFGHYAGAGQIPVPGYFTKFYLYNRDYNALPNEVMTPYNDGAFS